MFGKEQPDVVTDEDVGDYIKELQREGTTEVNQFIMEDPEEEEDGLDRDSEESTNRPQDSGELS